MTPDQQMLEDLRELHRDLIADLKARIKSGKASHQEFAVALKMLKDNGITLMPADDPKQMVGYREIEPARLPEFPSEGEE